MLTSANTSRTRQSVLEATIGQSIVHFKDLRLTGRFLSSQREEADFVLIQRHFATNEAVGPHLAEWPGLPHQEHRSAVAIASPQIDHPLTGRFFSLSFQPAGKARRSGAALIRAALLLAARPRRTSANGPANPPGRGAGSGTRPCSATSRCSSRSWPGSPSRRGGTKTGTTFRLRHSRMTPSQGIGVTMCVVEDRIVVELSIGRQTDRTPVLNQRLDSQFLEVTGDSTGQEAVRPPCSENGVEHLDVRPAFDDQALDNVDAVQGLARVWATSGKYHPVGGGGRRVLWRPSSAPRRPRMRLMVRTEGMSSTPFSTREW